MYVSIENVSVPAHTETKKWYVAADGQRFETAFECKNYESSLKRATNPMFATAIDNVCDETGHHATLYRICSHEDRVALIELLAETKDGCHISHDDYPSHGPGWYLCVLYDDGDDCSSCYLYHMESYIQEKQRDLHEWMYDLYDKTGDERVSHM